MAARLLIVPLALFLALAGGCHTTVDPDQVGRILVVNTRGVPIAGAIVVPYDENEARRNELTPDDLKAFTTDHNGMVTVLLEPYLWTEDGCYHFRVRRVGFEAATETVSRDLFPAQLRIELKAEGQP